MVAPIQANRSGGPSNLENFSAPLMGLSGQRFTPAASAPKPLGDLETISVLSSGARRIACEKLHPALRKLPLTRASLGAGPKRGAPLLGSAGNAHYMVDENRRSGKVTITYSPRGIAEIAKFQSPQTAAPGRRSDVFDPVVAPKNRNGEVVVSFAGRPDRD